MMRLLGGQPCIADLINDENTRGGVATKPLTYQAGIGGRLKRLCELGERRKQGRMPCRQGFDRKRDAEMGFPHSRGSPKNYIHGGLNEREVGEFPHQPLGDAGLKREIKGLQGLGDRKSCGLDPSLSRTQVASLHREHLRPGAKTFRRSSSAVGLAQTRPVGPSPVALSRAFSLHRTCRYLHPAQAVILCQGTLADVRNSHLVPQWFDCSS